MSLMSDLVDMRNWWKRTHAFGGPTAPPHGTLQHTIVMVGNDTATALERGHVLELDETLTGSDYWAYTWPSRLKGVKPTGSDVNVCVLLEPCPAKSGTTIAMANGQVSGVCMAKVDVAAITDTRAHPVADSHVLASGTSGVFTILSQLTTTGEQLVLVSFGSTGTGGGGEIISFRVLASGPFYSEIDVFCLRMRCEVVAVSCQGATVSVGDEIDVWDPNGTFFSVPIDILLNMIGTASKMAWDPDVGIPGDCFRDSTSEEIAALPYAGQCWWNVVNMSCVEEWYDSPY